MKYAIVQFGGKQIQIKEGDTFEMERQSGLVFDVLLYSENEKVSIGEPFLKDIEVKAKVVEEKRGKKIRIGRFKSKSRYRRVKGHRQPLGVVTIVSIGKKAAPAKKTTRKTTVNKTTSSTTKGVSKK